MTVTFVKHRLQDAFWKPVKFYFPGQKLTIYWLGQRLTIEPFLNLHGILLLRGVRRARQKAANFLQNLRAMLRLR